MKNDYRIGDVKISIPPTVLFSLVAKVPDVRRAVTMDFKAAGNFIYLMGTTRPELGASEYAAMKSVAGGPVPAVHDPKTAFACYKALYSAIRERVVPAAHDLSDGGLGVALSEMCFSGECGAKVDCAAIAQEGCTSDAQLLFSESQARILIEVEPVNASRVESLFSGLPLRRIGVVTKGDLIRIQGLDGTTVISLSRIDAKAAWKSTLQF
jgi:phosphoribosylformylglycinamidine synthase subunit PurSL